MAQRKMIIKSECSDGRKHLWCACGMHFVMNPMTMENAVYDSNATVIGSCPTCKHDQIPDFMDKIPKRRYGTIHITVLVRSDDYKQLEEKTIIAGLGSFTDFTAWAAKMSCRLPDNLLIKEIRIVQCSKEQYDEVQRQITISNLADASNDLVGRSLLAAFFEGDENV